MSPEFCVCIDFLVECSNNRNSRVDSGSTSTNGIVLFKSTANIICLYTQRRLVANIDYVLILVIQSFIEPSDRVIVSMYSFDASNHVLCFE